MTDHATIMTVEHGEPSDIPSPSWYWRRIYTFLLTAVAMLLLWRITERVTDVVTLRMVARYLCWTVGGLVFVYVAGATATDCVNMMSVLRSTRRQTTTTAPPPATLTSTPAGVTKVETPPDADDDDPTLYAGPRA